MSEMLVELVHDLVEGHERVERSWIVMGWWPSKEHFLGAFLFVVGQCKAQQLCIILCSLGV